MKELLTSAVLRSWRSWGLAKEFLFFASEVSGYLKKSSPLQRWEVLGLALELLN